VTDAEDDPLEIERLDPDTAADVVPALAEVLVDSVEHGASVGFVWPFSLAAAVEWWNGVVDDVAAGTVVLLVARRRSRVVGTVQLRLAQYPNGRHRAEVAKLLVLASARRQGIARRLMVALETEAVTLGRTLLVLDTATDAAERLYASLGYSSVGIVPGFAADPDGTLRGTTIMWRRLAE
jgi:ribosomal protein S18 acetylase RimI-like enzyme